MSLLFDMSKCNYINGVRLGMLGLLPENRASRPCQEGDVSLHVFAREAYLCQ